MKMFLTIDGKPSIVDFEEFFRYRLRHRTSHLFLGTTILESQTHLLHPLSQGSKSTLESPLPNSKPAISRL